MSYFLVRKGEIVGPINVNNGRDALKFAQDNEGIACLVIGGHTVSEEMNHLYPSDLDRGMPDTDFISEDDIKRIISEGGVDVRSEKTEDDNDKD